MPYLQPLSHNRGKQIFLHQSRSYNKVLPEFTWMKIGDQDFTMYRLEDELQRTFKLGNY